MDDGLPQYICKVCANLIKFAIRFRNQSHASEIKLIKYYKLKKKIDMKAITTSNRCRETDLIVPSTKIEVIIESNPRQDNLDAEHESATDHDSFNHISPTDDDQWINNEQSDKELDIEPVKQKVKENLKEKVTINAVDNRYLNMMEISDDTEKPNQCKICKKSMKTLNGLKAHVKRHILDFSILCEVGHLHLERHKICDFYYTERKITKQLQLDNFFNCQLSFCGKAENSQISLQRHQQAKHGLARGNRFHCSYCDYRGLDQEMLEIKMDDGLPQNICNACARFIEAAILFRNKSHASEKKLIEWHKHKRKELRNLKNISIEARMVKSEPVLSKQDFVVEIEPKLEKDHLDYESDTAGDNVNLISSTNDDGWCETEQANAEFNIGPENKKTEPAKNALLESTVDNDYFNMMETSNEPGKSYKCKVCNKSMKTQRGLQTHMTLHTLRYKVLCEFCGKPEFSRIHLLRHQQAKHGLARDNRYVCSYCGYKALDQEMLEVHERHTHTKERPFVCDECGEAFYSKRVLKQHFLKHTTDKPFHCNQCQKNYKSRSRLTGHIMLVHRTRKYEYGCPHCPKTYYKPWESRKHIERIHGIPKDQQGKIPRFNLQQKDL